MSNQPPGFAPRAALVSLLGLIVGCAGAPEEEGPPIVFDACAPTLLRLAADTSTTEREAVEAALSLWQEALGPKIAFAAETPEAAGQQALEVWPEGEAPQVLPIGFEPAAPAFFGIYRPARGDILINRELHTPRARAITIAHEIGHAFGLPHVSGRASLMNPGNLQVPPSSEESRLMFASSGCPQH